MTTLVAPVPPPETQKPAGRGKAGGLLQILGVAFGLAIIVGNTIGMGILRTPGDVAARLPSVPLFMAVWLIGGTYALLGALSTSELSAMHPRSGGLYPLVTRGLGKGVGFITGWTDWLATNGSVAAVAIVLGQYAGPLVGPLEGHETLTASGVVIFFALLQWRGIRIGDAAQRATSLLKALALIALAAVALVVGSDAAPAAAHTIVIPSGTLLAGAIVVALQSVIYTYDGWTGPVYFGEELVDAERAIPQSMIGGVLLVLGIYLALNVAFLAVVPIAEMAGDPFVAATAARKMFGQNGDTTIRILMIISLIASVNALLLMASRVPYALSRDRLLPAKLSEVNKGGTPLPSLLLSTGVTLALILTNTFNSLLAMLAFCFVLNYALTFASLFTLRIREPDAPRPFRVPLYPWVPGIALVGSCAFMVGALISDRRNTLWALGLVAISIPLYLVIRRMIPDTAE
ncbi:MAG: APC family permease [Longimicrobiales bacterium]